MDWISNNAGLFGMGLAALFALLLAGVYFCRQHQATRHERHVEKIIRTLGAPYLHDVVLPDGIEGLAFIDYLLLTPKGIVVLTIKHREGLLFGGTHVDQWTQVVNRKTIKFNNPLYLQPQYRQAVEWNSEDVTTYGWVVLSNAGQFQKGIPAGCCMIDDLTKNLMPLLDSAAEPTKSLRDAWVHLQDLSVTSRAELGRQPH